MVHKCICILCAILIGIMHGNQVYYWYCCIAACSLLLLLTTVVAQGTLSSCYLFVVTCLLTLCMFIGRYVDLVKKLGR